MKTARIKSQNIVLGARVSILKYDEAGHIDEVEPTDADFEESKEVGVLIYQNET